MVEVYKRRFQLVHDDMTLVWQTISIKW